MNIYVSNISFHTTEDILREMFSKFGRVISVRIATDKATGKPKGFGFVQMSNFEEGAEAIRQLTDVNMQGRLLRLSVARH